MVLDKTNIALKKALNIFTDASVEYNTNISLPACIKIEGESWNMCNPIGMALSNSTNNEGEVYAVKMAIQSCLNPTILNMMDNLYGGRFINIFSDSKITVFGLREWYASWIQNKKNGILITSSGTPVKNQEIFISIIRMIHDYDLKVNFYHVSGHVNYYSQKAILESMRDFKRFNYGIAIPNHFACELAILNDKIDQFSRSIPTDRAIDIKTNEIFKVSIEENFDINKYTNLIQRRI